MFNRGANKKTLIERQTKSSKIKTNISITPSEKSSKLKPTETKLCESIRQKSTREKLNTKVDLKMDSKSGEVEEFDPSKEFFAEDSAEVTPFTTAAQSEEFDTKDGENVQDSSKNQASDDEVISIFFACKYTSIKDLQQEYLVLNKDGDEILDVIKPHIEPDCVSSVFLFWEWALHQKLDLPETLVWIGDMAVKIFGSVKNPLNPITNFEAIPHSEQKACYFILTAPFLLMDIYIDEFICMLDSNYSACWTRFKFILVQSYSEAVILCSVRNREYVKDGLNWKKILNRRSVHSLTLPIPRPNISKTRNTASNDRSPSETFADDTVLFSMTKRRSNRQNLAASGLLNSLGNPPKTKKQETMGENFNLQPQYCDCKGPKYPENGVLKFVNMTALKFCAYGHNITIEDEPSLTYAMADNLLTAISGMEDIGENRAELIRSSYSKLMNIVNPRHEIDSEQKNLDDIKTMVSGEVSSVVQPMQILISRAEQILNQLATTPHMIAAHQTGKASIIDPLVLPKVNNPLETMAQQSTHQPNISSTDADDMFLAIMEKLKREKEGEKEDEEN